MYMKYIKEKPTANMTVSGKSHPGTRIKKRISAYTDNSSHVWEALARAIMQKKIIKPHKPAKGEGKLFPFADEMTLYANNFNIQSIKKIKNFTKVTGWKINT